MRWFTNLRISAKLISCFVLVAILTGIVGGVGIFNLNKIDRNYSDLYVNYGIGMGDIGRSGIDFHKMRSLTRDALINHVSQNRNEILDKLKVLDGQLETDLNAFKLSIQTKEAEEIFNKLQDTLGQYNIVRNQAIEMAGNGQKEEAFTFFYNNTGAIVANANQYIDDLFASKQTNGLKKSTDNSDMSRETIIIMLVIVVIAVVIAVVLGFIISRLIGKPVNKLVDAANRIADGDLNIDIDTRSKDEIGQLAEAFRRMSANLNEVMVSIKSASEQVASGSKQMSESSMALSQGATEQASSIEELTASIEEIAAQTSQNASSAEQVNLLTQGAMDNAVDGNSQMKDMLQAMEQINDSSGSISKIIKVIDEIAFQTNILALNAAVEAARAGQHGKGFAVVAEEVRNLAARSANAAKETTVMIESSIKKVERGTKIAGVTASALEKIVEDISKVAKIMTEITAASSEQAAGISQINQGVLQLSQVVQTNSATAEETASASEELAGQAELMREHVEQFKVKEQTRDVYNGMEDLNPDVLRMLERMAKNKGGYEQVSSKEWAKERTAAPVTISLSDKEFGKYGL